jgi:lysophospholipase L1-like esterase
MKRHPEWKVLNRGVRGQRTDQILDRFDYDVLQTKADVVIILAGVNDVYQGLPADAITPNLDRMYLKARENGIPVMACTIMPYNFAGEKAVEVMKQVNAWIRERAEQLGLGFCDTHAALSVPGRPDMIAMTADGLHPDVAGYRRMGDAIANALEAWLRVPPAVMP